MTEGDRKLMKFITTSEEQTQKAGEKLAKKLSPGDVIALYGDLGAGKTVFVQGLAKGLGIKKRILSPTFVFLRTYSFKKEGVQVPLNHVDLYRWQGKKDFESLGLEDIFSQKGIIVIEWADRIKNLPEKRIEIKIDVLDEKTRRITTTSSPVILRSEATKDIKKAAQILKFGGVIIFPTDTVYGIGCIFNNQEAIKRIREIKGTPIGQQFPVLVSSVSEVEKIADVNQTARDLMDEYWPGGLTIILSSHHPESAFGPKDLKTRQKTGFRMPDSKLIKDLIRAVGKPIIGTSANFHGQKTPTKYGELNQELIKKVDLVLEGDCKKGYESTVVDATIYPPKVLRQGAIKL